MINLTGEPAKLRFTLQIKRAVTGEIEIVQMVGDIERVEQTNMQESNKHLEKQKCQ